jgi:hypothetical protein
MNQEIEIEQIITNGGTESRPLNQQFVGEYAEVYQADPTKLPALDVFFGGKQYWLGDGFHRLEGAKVSANSANSILFPGKCLRKRASGVASVPRSQPCGSANCLQLFWVGFRFFSSNSIKLPISL